jgi:hypothetical protein
MTLNEWQERNPRDKGQPRDEYERESRREYRNYIVSDMWRTYDVAEDQVAFNKSVLYFLESLT